MNRINRRFPSPSGVWVVSHQSGPAPSNKTFPSPSGVWVVSAHLAEIDKKLGFPSPCGVWVVSMKKDENGEWITRFRPLAGCGLFLESTYRRFKHAGFRPLAGCGLFLP